MKAKLLQALKRAHRAPRNRYEEDHKTSAAQEGRRQALRAPLPSRAGGRRGLRHAAVQPESDAELQRIAAEYNQKQGLNPPSHTDYVHVDEALAMKIADAYEAMEHNPQDPRVRKAYDAFIREVKLQWDHLEDAGYVLEPWKKEGQPYQSSREMVDDVRKNHHLYFFQGGDMPADHPLIVTDESGLSANDKFRAVHDIFGHAKGGYQFGPRGEENAYRAHRDMFTPDAIRALRNETEQNAWVNFFKHMRDENGQLIRQGDPRWLHPTQRPYAEQKAGILPEREDM